MKLMRLEFVGMIVLVLLTALSTAWQGHYPPAVQATEKLDAAPSVIVPRVAAASLPTKGSAEAAEQNRSGEQAAGGDVARGKYLVEEVARCWECHTPVKSDGSWDRSRWLQGGPVFIRPVVPSGTWAERAPTLAGFPGFTEEQGEHILEKGEAPDGRALQQPMHTYHLRHEDAVAIIGYLKTLTPNPR